MKDSTPSTKFVVAFLLGLVCFGCNAEKIDQESIKACLLEARDANSFEALKCFEDLDPTLDVLKLRSADGKPLSSLLRDLCQMDWANGDITAKQRNQCIRRLAKFE